MVEQPSSSVADCSLNVILSSLSVGWELDSDWKENNVSEKQNSEQGSGTGLGERETSMWLYSWSIPEIVLCAGLSIDFLFHIILLHGSIKTVYPLSTSLVMNNNDKGRWKPWQGTRMRGELCRDRPGGPECQHHGKGQLPAESTKGLLSALGAGHQFWWLFTWKTLLISFLR